jgi:hypothetical protein
MAVLQFPSRGVLLLVGVEAVVDLMLGMHPYQKPGLQNFGSDGQALFLNPGDCLVAMKGPRLRPDWRKGGRQAGKLNLWKWPQPLFHRTSEAAFGVHVCNEENYYMDKFG